MNVRHAGLLLRRVILLTAALTLAGVPLPTLAAGPASSRSDATTQGTIGSTEFPAGDTRYHTYAEMSAEVAAVAAAHPGIVRRSSVGTSFEGRQLWLVKISDHVMVDENEPEVFFNGLTHAREHLTVEMSLALLHWLVDGYGSDTQVTRLVDSREVWILFMVNPDGAEYDISGGSYHSWRKNRQPTAGSSSVGTDLNRNFGWHWGCCGGSSSDPAGITYRGPLAWSAPEVRAERDFVRSRVVGGRQQIRTAVSFHSFGAQVLYPYGYTYADLPSEMTSHDRAAFVNLAGSMAGLNGYRAEQESDMYITSGTFLDWAYGEQRIFSFTFELGPSTVAAGGFYPPDEQLGILTGRNRSALLYLIGQADCPYRPAGLAASDCGPFYDDLEVNRGWRIDPAGTDTAMAGTWARGDAGGTNFDGPKQLATAASGRTVFATGLAAGSSATSNDLDGGITTARSPEIRFPATGGRLTFRYSFAHSAYSSSADYLRVRVSSATSSRVVWSLLGRGSDRDALWTSASIDLSAFAGQTIRLQFEAADAGTPSLVEAAFDDVRVVAP